MFEITDGDKEDYIYETIKRGEQGCIKKILH